MPKISDPDESYTETIDAHLNRLGEELSQKRYDDMKIIA